MTFAECQQDKAKPIVKSLLFYRWSYVVIISISFFLLRQLRQERGGSGK